MTTALIGLGCVFGGAVVGMGINAIRPEPLTCAETRDVVKAATGMLSLLAALVLGLLLSSAKSSFDTKTKEVQEFAANLALFDSVLRDYGPETRPIRDLMREATTVKVHRIWPETDTDRPMTLEPGQAGRLEAVQAMVLGLTPQDNAQRWLQSRALQISSDIDHQRWLLGAQSGSSIQPPFLYVLLCWITVLFFSFGLFARRNVTTLVALFICAASISAAIVLILDMDSPFEGIIRLSPEPVLHVLKLMAVAP
jgi:hypothetical protein